MRSRLPVSGASKRRLRLVTALLVASILLTLGVALRIERTGSTDTWNLVWNLFLAWIPFALALVVYDGVRRRKMRLAIVAGAFWLLFLPNAPYIVTDAVWLDDWAESGVPRLYDLGLYVVAAGTGAILGFVSLYLVQRAVARTFSETAGWLLAVASLVLTGIGVYLGRVLRWNSWDAFTRPGALVDDLAQGLLDPLAYPKAVALVVACASALVIGYVVFYGVLRAQLDKLDDR
jgi:uncharacterized membrane protein